MRLDRPFARIVAVVLVVCLQTLFVPATRAADAPAALTGTVLSVDGGRPVAGVRVLAGDRETGKITSSDPTGNDGTFQLDHLAAQTYELAVKSGGGLYVVQNPVRLKPGETRQVQLMVGTASTDDPTTATPDKDKKKERPVGVWENPVTATLVVLGAALVVGVLVDQATDEEGPASPATP